MEVAHLMTRKLITVAPLDSVEKAIKWLRQRGVRHLLVMQKNQLVGILSDRDLKRALDSGTKKRVMSVGGLYFLMEPILVEEIMTPNPVTIGPDTTPQEAARLMVNKKFGALPVVDGGKTVGIVTETDLLKYFATGGTADEGSPAVPAPRKKVRRKAARR